MLFFSLCTVVCAVFFILPSIRACARTSSVPDTTATTITTTTTTYLCPAISDIQLSKRFLDLTGSANRPYQMGTLTLEPALAPASGYIATCDCNPTPYDTCELVLGTNVATTYLVRNQATYQVSEAVDSSPLQSTLITCNADGTVSAEKTADSTGGTFGQILCWSF
uniref:Uncharacterized protein n=1 Tax=Plectus sambesii TaxID=2011161 RepID=A0A914W8I8_9BILA